MTNWTNDPYPTAPWDTAGLPPRTMAERCARHKHCVYRDDDPNRCPLCHATNAKCAGLHGGMPFDGWGGKGGRGAQATGRSSTLWPGQYFDPRVQASVNSTGPQPQEPPVFQPSREELIHA